MSSLIERLKERITNPNRATDGANAIKPSIAKPAKPAEVDAAEAVLGFSLPLFLRALYIEVGNGGYGPGYGLIGVSAKETVKRIILCYWPRPWRDGRMFTSG